jgi:hypothetical protein
MGAAVGAALNLGVLLFTYWKAVAVVFAVAVAVAHGDPSSLCRITRWKLVPPTIYSVTYLRP